MNRYFLVLDSKNRLVFRKKIDRGQTQTEEESLLLKKYQKLDYSSYLVEGKTFAAALHDRDIKIHEESAFYIKKDLKNNLHFTDKSIKELLGEPDRVEKIQGPGDKSIHQYAKTRVEAVLESPEYQEHAEKVKSGREDRKKTRKESRQRHQPAREHSHGEIRKESQNRLPSGHTDSFYGPTDSFGDNFGGGGRPPGSGTPEKPAKRSPIQPADRSNPWSDRGSERDRDRNAPGRPKRSGYSLENLAKERLKTLAGKLRKDWDLNEYKEFFPAARELKRKHTFFVGPTNSGKSYRGFNELASSFSGVYLAPLRLLALEGQEEVEKRGKECSLLTGEEMELKEGAHFIASTVEMANLEKPIDCALIDEVQLILDRNRGWAWSQALVGIPAKRIIMTGSEECIPLLKKLVEEYLEEELEIVRLERIGKLEVISKTIGNISQVETGSAIISFSRRGVLALKKELEDAGRRVSVLYGNLSPGVRKEEAKRFRSGETDILVATDCIGMGLNLPIKTVLFSETTKFDGTEVRDLSAQEVKQIAGRAGRYGKFECGYVGVGSGGSIGLIKESLDTHYTSLLESCFVRPTQTQLEILRNQIGGNSIKNAISLFSQLSQKNSTIVCSDLTEMLGLADRIDSTPSLAEMSFSDKYLFTCAPVSATDLIIESFIQWLDSYARGVPVQINKEDYRAYSSGGSTTEDNVLNYAENCVKILTLYHWLARKKSHFFPSLELCEDLRDRINDFIENSLKRKGLHKKCPECSKKLPLHYMHKLCNDCYRGKKR